MPFSSNEIVLLERSSFLQSLDQKIAIRGGFESGIVQFELADCIEFPFGT